MGTKQHEWRFGNHVCEKAAVTEPEEEKETVSGCQFKCSLCGKQKRDPSGLRNHIILAHYNREIRSLCIAPTGEDKNDVKKCHECDFATRTISSLIVHYGSIHERLSDVAPQEVMKSIPRSRKRSMSSFVRHEESNTKKVEDFQNIIDMLD